MRTLVTGWFSFYEMGASAGDLMARDLACAWLEESGQQYDVALAPPFLGGVDWRSVDPLRYSRVLFVCGPFANGSPVTELRERFPRCQWIGLNLSMLEPLNRWNPFQILWERDSDRQHRPDIAFLSPEKPVPVAGLLLIGDQPEYDRRDMHREAKAALSGLIDSREMTVVQIDTRLDVNSAGLRTPAEIESLIARMDLVLTTRLHGLVLALKNGVPAVALDPVAGGAKILYQAKAVGWPAAFVVDSVSPRILEDAFDFCLTEEARARARECRERAMATVLEIKKEFTAAMARPA